MSPAAVEAILHDFERRATRVGATQPDGSELWRFGLDGHTYVLHYYPADDTPWRRHLGGADAARQFTQLQALQKLGVPATRVIANLKGFRIGPRKGDACIVVDDPAIQPLSTVAAGLPRMNYLDRVRLTASLMQRLGEVHRHRMTPRPLRAWNFGRRGDGQVTILDGTPRMSGTVDADRLHELDASTRHLTTRADRLRVWRHFTGESTPVPRKDRALTSQARQLARASLAASGEVFGAFDVDDDGDNAWRGVFLRRLPIVLPWSAANDLVLDLDGWRAALPTLLNPAAAGWTALKNDHASQVFAGTLRFADARGDGNAGRELSAVVKRPATPSGFRGFVKRLRPSRGQRAWLKTWRLLGQGFPCEVPLLWIERRRGAGWADPLIVFERVPGPTMERIPLDDLSPEHRAALLADCGRTLGRLEAAGFAHNDAKDTNWIAWTDAADRPRGVLIDCDGVERFTLRGRAIPRFVRAMRKHASFSEADLQQILTAFARGRSGGRRG